MENCNISEIIIYHDPRGGVHINSNDYTDELKITNNSIECKRYFSILEESIMWKMTFIEEKIKEEYLKVATLISQWRKPLIVACDGDLVVIKTVLENGEIVKEEYTGTFSDNRMSELIKAILQLIPQGCFYPECIR